MAVVVASEMHQDHLGLVTPPGAFRALPVSGGRQNGRRRSFFCVERPRPDPARSYLGSVRGGAFHAAASSKPARSPALIVQFALRSRLQS